LQGIPYAWDGFGVGKTVVIQGLGPIGILTAAAAKSSGARKIIGIEGVDLRIKLAQKFGVDHIIDLKTFAKPEERINEVRRLTGGLGGDVVIELAGVPTAFHEGIEMTRRGGKYVEIGHFTDVGTIPVNPQHIAFRDLDIFGVWAYPPTVLKEAISLLEMTIDAFPYKELVTHKFPLTETEKALITSRNKECCKALIVTK
jgi:L-iditol 2-dehydrogenase